MSFRRLAAAGVVCSVVLGGHAMADVGAAENVQVTRLAGPTRYGTAGAVAVGPFQGKGRSAVLVRGDDYPDGLTATNLAFDLPLLLTQRDSIPAETDDAIRRLPVAGLTIVGGESAVSAGVEQTLRARGIEVTRIAGDNRYATAAETYSRTYTWESSIPRSIDGKTTILLASGEGFADALTASPLAQAAALPILLTRRDQLPPETKRWLPGQGVGCANGICIEQVIILGGASAVGPGVEAELHDLGITTRRLQGADRYETAVAVARFARDEIGWTVSHFNLVRGDTFPDALASGALGGSEAAPTLLTVGPHDLGEATRSFIRENRATVTSFHVLGDATAVSDAVVADARAAKRAWRLSVVPPRHAGGMVVLAVLVALAVGVVVGWTLGRRRPAGEVGAVHDELRRLQESLAQTHGELRQQLRATNEQTASLRDVLASPRSRGHWGERLADDVLRHAGLVEGVSYVKQRATRHGTVPDVTFLLPGERVLHMDVKFPLDNRAVPEAFVRDVRARVRELTGRGYVDPAAGTLDYVLLFVPNESLYGFVHEHDPGLIDEALRRKVVLCSPLTLYAVLAVVRRAAEVAALERTSGEVLAVLGTFTQEWDRFCDALDKVGRSVDAVERAYGDLAGTRRRALERPLVRIDELRRGRGDPERLRAVP